MICSMNRRLAPAAIVFGLMISGCASVGGVHPDMAPAAVKPAVSVQSALHEMVMARKADFAEQLQAFYAARDFRPAWTADEKNAAELTRILSHAHDQGLRDEEYLVSAPAPNASARNLAAYDIALSEAALRYARDLQFGRVLPGEIYEDVALPVTAPFDGADDLAGAVMKHNVAAFFAARVPAHPAYRNLARALARYRESSPERAAIIAANMERWRWLPQQLESRFVMVNVPDESVQFVRDGKVMLTSRVIVGRKNSPTPITRSEIQAVVVNPPWNIPGDIAARDLLPHLKQNPNYLAEKRMVVTDGLPNDPYGRKINWRKVTAADFPYAIRQLPGPQTALGSLMLDSPNDFDVYLHDTPNKKFFGQDDREISNGCVRVQQIMPLASLALTDDAERGQTKLKQAIKTGKTQRVPLESALPVYFAYWTAVADDDGDVQFRSDIYGRDAALIAALSGKPHPRPKRIAPPDAMSADLTP